MVGADRAQADSLCWPCGAGYGNNWCQRATSEPLTYDGNGDVTLSFLYFANIEPCYDGLQIYSKRADESELLLNPYPAGTCWNNDGYEGGSITDSIGSYDNPETYTRVITAQEIGAAQEIRVVFEFVADGGYSDADRDFCTTHGPFGADEITVTGGSIDANYDFEDGLQGWSPHPCIPLGDFVDVVDVGCYTILDPCDCRLEGNVLEMHDGFCDAGFHPEGQDIMLMSPICDFGTSEPKTIFMEFDMYAEMPHDNGVLIRPGWYYYPWTCEVTGEIGWSPRRFGRDGYNYFGDSEICDRWL